MTNGAFIEVELDEEFTPSVVRADGRSRPVSWLSGGELSVVALALRIAIGDMLTGGTGGLLWLDEVLVSQDAGRRASLIETLRSLTGRQIVMINHTQGADDIVDKSIRLTRSPDGGTVLDES
jgi:exonuclease SbcC